MLRRAALVLVASGLACQTQSAAPAPAPSASIVPWSREAFAAPGAAAASADAAVPTAPDPDALDELLAAAPKPAPQPAAAPSIGVDTGRPPDEPPALAIAPPRTARVTVGAPEVQAPMSTPSIERAARAQLYWPLVQRCRDHDGRVLPPDAVRLGFNIDPDGYIVATSITAVADDPRFADAAHCMRRELSAATFRAPPTARGRSASVTATVPSVD